MKQEIVELKREWKYDKVLLKNNILFLSPNLWFYIMPLFLITIMFNIILTMATDIFPFWLVILFYSYLNLSFLYIFIKKNKSLSINYQENSIALEFHSTLLKLISLNNKIKYRFSPRILEFDEVNEFCVGHSINGIWLGWFVFAKKHNGEGVPLYYSNNKKFIFQLKEILIKYNQQINLTAVLVRRKL
ncbi:MAG: hypothetical protein IPM32_14365 [Ignavibacteriae bacterium]|nr:hypothetical protein [Ignavibacteriota bacterium]